MKSFEDNPIQDSKEISAILLMAGLASRMGGPNKLLLPFGKTGNVMLTTLESIQKSHPAQIIVVTGRDNQIIELICKRYYPQFEVIHNPDYEKGMTTSIQCGVRAANNDTKGYMICLGDMPGISPETYNVLMSSHISNYQNNPNTITIPMIANQSGHPKILSNRYREQILEHQEIEGCKSIIRQNKQHHNLVEISDQACLEDIDTIEDLARLYTKYNL